MVETQEFYFEPLPNLAPNPTSFITPLAGAVYDSNEITISWNPGTDPNNDSLTYNIYYYDDSSTTTIESVTTTISFVWDVSAVPDGAYGLMGEVCDDADTPLCTEFYLSADFTLDRVEDIFSVSDVSISSNNATTNLAKAGDTITLSFTASGDISPTLAVDFYSGGANISNSITSSSLANVWTVYYSVSASDTEGTVDYVITANNLDYEYSSSTPILIDLTAPAVVSASPTAGNYSAAQSISLNSTGSSQIRYTLDGTNPNCATGSVYNSAINLSTLTTLTAVGCDEAGNSSALASLQYEFSAMASAPITLPSGVGDGVDDRSIPMGTARDIGSLSGEGVNVLAYINSQAGFVTPLSSLGWQDGPNNFQITDLDLFNQVITLTTFPQTKKVVFKKGGSQEVDLDGDHQNDIKLTFVDTYVNRAEITIKSLAPTSADNNHQIDTAVPAQSIQFMFRRDLKSGLSGTDVKELQKFLNTNGFVVAKSGVGSPGKETSYFGQLTRLAVIKFQKTKGIFPAVGYFGPITRQVVNGW